MTSSTEGIINPPIDELLERTQSKYALVIIAAKRARQINAYYSQLGEGLLEYVGPLVDTAPQEKPLSIALREVNADLIEFRPMAVGGDDTAVLADTADEADLSAPSVDPATLAVFADIADIAATPDTDDLDNLDDSARG